MAKKPIFARIHFSRAPVCTLLISRGKAVCGSYRIIHLVEGRSTSDLDSKTDNSKRTPGLSAYAKDPEAAAKSLTELLEKAEAVVPEELRYITPVKVGATAGLRQLEGDASDRILQAVRDYLKNKSSLKSKADWVTVLDGNQEGAYQWVTINYLLGNLGKKYSSTVGVVDLGGGSVQMAYAVSESDAAKAPKLSGGEESYVQQMYLKGRKYYLYIHSYLHYGLLAAGAEILKIDQESGSPCLLAGYDAVYKST